MFPIKIRFIPRLHAEFRHRGRRNSRKRIDRIRRIIGWAFAHRLGTELVAAAVVMALAHRRPPQGLVRHSDRGVQYASFAYRQLLQAYGVLAGMSRKVCCYDYAAAEAPSPCHAR